MLEAQPIEQHTLLPKYFDETGNWLICKVGVCMDTIFDSVKDAFYNPVS